MMGLPIKSESIAVLGLLVSASLGVYAADEGTVPKPAAEQATPVAQLAPTPDAVKLTPQPFRGVFFNPQIGDRDHPWLVLYPEYRAQVRAILQELASTTNMNMVVIYVNIPYSLKTPSQAPNENQPLAEWANTAYLDNVADFVDDCFGAGLTVELDLASNLWVPYSVDPENQIANSGNWPMPDETPWNEAATWYSGVISYIEGKAKHPENIALWVMTGNYQLGHAEPCLWPNDSNPALLAATEKLVKNVWPVFRSAGKRPKAAPFMFCIFSNASYWMPKSREERLAGFFNLKKWIVDDLGMPPDYWMITAYPCCDPAPDGFYYLRTMVEILGRENAPRIFITDLKGPGHEPEYKDTILSVDGYSGADLLEWHWRKFQEYGIQNWWIWAYQDTSQKTPWAKSGLRSLDGKWKMDLVQAIRKQAPQK